MTWTGDLINSRNLFIYIFKDFYLFIFRERGREGEREGNINVWLPLCVPHNGDLARNPGMCPTWELNQWPFSAQASTQSTEPHQPGLISKDLLLTVLGCWKFKIRVLAWLDSGESTVPDSRLPTSHCNLAWREKLGSSLGFLFIRVLIQFMGDLHLWLYQFLRAPLLNIITLQLKISTSEVCGTQIFQPYKLFFKFWLVNDFHQCTNPLENQSQKWAWGRKRSKMLNCAQFRRSALIFESCQKLTKFHRLFSMPKFF